MDAVQAPLPVRSPNTNRKKRRHACAEVRVKPQTAVKPSDYQAGLPTIGDRATAVCTNCFHRGHVSNAVRICPYKILKKLLNDSQTDPKAWKYHIDKLITVTNHIWAAIDMMEGTGVDIYHLKKEIVEYDILTNNCNYPHRFAMFVIPELCILIINPISLVWIG
jgi:hypothetical protein